MIGVETSDDAAVYKINESTAIVQTLDFFTPIVDDAYTFGKIAAANSLSDVYAMGADPKIAMNILCFPNCIDPYIMGEIIRGGSDKVMEANCLLVGGHTVQDDEPKYGLSVTGFTHPDHIWSNANAKAGDVLVITKPIGMGIINTAIKGGICEKSHYKEAVEAMEMLNKDAKEAAEGLDIHSCTDITGFGLLGHLYEMAQGSNCTFEIDHNEIPFIEGTVEYSSMGLVPKGAYDNQRFVGEEVLYMDNISDTIKSILFDPQTSGGLLFSLSLEDATVLKKRLKSKSVNACIIGKVIEKEKVSLKVY